LICHRRGTYLELATGGASKEARLLANHIPMSLELDLGLVLAADYG